MSTLAQLVEPVGARKPEEPKPPEPIHDGGLIVDVIPYHGDNDINSFQMLPWLWKRLKDDGLLALYYPKEADKSFCGFTKLLSSPVTRVLLVVLRSPDDPTDVKDIVGFATYEPLQFGPAMLGHTGFIFLKSYWDRHVSLEAGKRILEWWFDRNDESLDVLVGLIASDNRLANRFVQRMGWTRMGELPGCQEYEGKQCDAIQWRFTRGDWLRTKEGVR